MAKHRRLRLSLDDRIILLQGITKLYDEAMRKRGSWSTKNVRLKRLHQLAFSLASDHTGRRSMVGYSVWDMKEAHRNLTAFSDWIKELATATTEKAK